MRELCVLSEPETYGGASVTSQDQAGDSVPRSTLHVSAKGVNIAKIIAEKMESNTLFLSVELIPGTTPQLKRMLDQSLKILKRRPPCFASVSWHAHHLKIETSGKTFVVSHPALDLSKLLQNEYGIPVLMHLPAATLKYSDIRLILQACVAAGVTNILALRGDNVSKTETDFNHASDLVRFIREEFGPLFTIAVAGYPSGHPQSKSLMEDMKWLKEKVDAGANFIVTQMITSFEEFEEFSHGCQKIGVNVPIVPGILITESFSSFQRVVQVCQVKVQQAFFEKLQNSIMGPVPCVYGFHVLQDILQNIFKITSSPGVHFFTMNRVSTVLQLCSDTKIFEL